MRKILLSLALLLSGCVGVAPLANATVNSTINQVIYNGDNTSTVFSFSFKIYLTSDLILQEYNQSTGNLTATLVLNSDYTVSISSNGTGSITLLGGALATGTQLLIQRSIPYTQLINISDYSATPAATWNQGFDRATILSQQLNSAVSRAILQSPLSSTSITFPSPVSGQCIGWSGTSLTNLGCSGGGGGSGFTPPIPDSQLQSIVSATKVAGSALYSLASIPGGAGTIPTANLNAGTSASQLVQLTAAAKYPAVDGSLITKIDGSNLLNLSSTPSGAGILPIANIATGTPTGTKFVRDDGTLQTAGGSYSLISNTPVTASANSGNISITGSGYYKVIFYLGDLSAQDNLRIIFNADSGTGYNYAFDGRTTSGAVTGGAAGANGGITITSGNINNDSDTYASGEFLITPDTASSKRKTAMGKIAYTNAAGLSVYLDFMGFYVTGGGTTSFQIYTVGGATMTGTVLLYKLSTS